MVGDRHIYHLAIIKEADIAKSSQISSLRHQ
jgi:hypothetical protein